MFQDNIEVCIELEIIQDKTVEFVEFEKLKYLEESLCAWIKTMVAF